MDDVTPQQTAVILLTDLKLRADGQERRNKTTEREMSKVVTAEKENRCSYIVAAV